MLHMMSPNAPDVDLLSSFEAAWHGTAGPGLLAADDLRGGIRSQDTTRNSSAPFAFEKSRMSGISGVREPNGGVNVPVASSKRPYLIDIQTDAGPPMLPNTPFPSHMLLKSQSSKTAAAPVPTPVPTPPAPVPTPAASLGMKAAPGKKLNGEFPPVFFSPIPLSYLSIAQSKESLDDSFLDSPDSTKRVSRLANAGVSGDWTSEAASLSESGDGLLSPRLQEEVKVKPTASAVAANTVTASPVQVAQPASHMPGRLGFKGTTGRASPVLQHPSLSRPPVPVLLKVPQPSVPAASTGLPFQSSALSSPGGMSIAAAASGKRQNQKWGTLKLSAGIAMIPHVDKVEKGGEDAACVIMKALGAISVADGVSGWAEEGIDPAEYSRTLIRYAAHALETCTHPHGADSREVIRFAHHSTVMPGSSTICVAVMKPNGKMQVANLGDSGLRVVRDGKIVFASSAQQHMFNMPFQLSHPSIIESPDDADCADVSLVDVQPGDIIVMATDGLYDNVFDWEIAQICVDALRSRRASISLAGAGGDAPPSPASVTRSLREDAARSNLTSADAEYLALAIARVAHTYAQNTHQKTPWSVSACETKMPWSKFFIKGGGKMDDVTVVVGFVVEEDLEC